MQLGYDIFTESQDFLDYFIQSNVCILYGYMATWRRISQLLFSAIAPDILGGLGKRAAAVIEMVVVIAVIIEALGNY